MTKDQYNEKLLNKKKVAKLSEEKLNEEYALFNNPYLIGSILKDHYQIIKVEKIDVVHPSTFGRYPFCVYTGKRLKANLKPYRSGEKSSMFQTNVEEKLK